LGEIVSLRFELLFQIASMRLELLYQCRLGFTRRSNACSRLRSARTKLATACSPLRPLASQGHLVGTVTGPFPGWVQPRMGPVNPNRTSRLTRVVSLDHLVGA